MDFGNWIDFWMKLQCSFNVLTIKTSQGDSSIPSDRGTGQFVLVSTHALVSAGPIPSDGISGGNTERKETLRVFRDYCHCSPGEQDTRKTNSKEILLQLAALVRTDLIHCGDGSCSVKTRNESPWSLTMSQLVEHDAFQTHVIWAHFYKDSKRLCIASQISIPCFKTSHQNGFPDKHF